MTTFEKSKIEDASIFCYHLNDGSYIMAEEVDYDLDQEVIFVINPVKINLEEGKMRLTQWCMTEISQPVFLRDSSIVSSHEASTMLRRNYFQFGLYDMMSLILPKEEINEILKLLSPVVDSTNEEEELEDVDFDFSKPYEVEEIKKKKKKNPWDRY